MIDELVINAAVGTVRKPPALPGGTPALQDTLAILSGTSAEATLLGAVAVLSRYEAAGRLPGESSQRPEPSEAETRPSCTRRAAELLAQILGLANTPAKVHLAGEWLDHCRRLGQRVPHRLLPALLDYGASHRDARGSVAEAAGARGGWLMRLNPRWRYEVSESEDPAAVWSTGTREQRLAALSRRRRVDPAAAREMILSTWKEDAADDRAAFVAAMSQSLVPADEALLESCLDDRSKQVRSAAADLLARLPSSAYVRRMIDRAEPLLKLIPATRTGLLRKLAPASLEVMLPPDAFDPAWARDAIVEKPTEKIGRRQWYLQQFLAAIPPTHWSEVWKLAPEQCIDAVSPDYVELVLSAWNQAARRRPDPAWNAALLRASAREGRGPLTLELLNDLPDEPRKAVTAEIILSPRSTVETVNTLLRVGNFTLGSEAATALTRQIENESWNKSNAGYSFLLAQVLSQAALRIPPGMYDELSDRWTGDKWETNRKALDEFFAILLIRRDIQREFDS